MDEKESLTIIDLLAIRQVKGKLETLDAEFRRCHVAVVDELEDDEELEYEQAISMSKTTKSLTSPSNSIIWLTVSIPVSVLNLKARHNYCYASV